MTCAPGRHRPVRGDESQLCVRLPRALVRRVRVAAVEAEQRIGVFVADACRDKLSAARRPPSD